MRFLPLSGWVFQDYFRKSYGWAEQKSASLFAKGNIRGSFADV